MYIHVYICSDGQSISLELPIICDSMLSILIKLNGSRSQNALYKSQ